VIQQGAEVDDSMYIIVTGTVGVYVGDQGEAGSCSCSMSATLVLSYAHTLE
jgi:hypothetical protein